MHPAHIPLMRYCADAQIMDIGNQHIGYKIIAASGTSGSYQVFQQGFFHQVDIHTHLIVANQVCIIFDIRNTSVFVGVVIQRYHVYGKPRYEVFHVQGRPCVAV